MNEDIRETFHSVEYDEYYTSLDEKKLAELKTGSQHLTEKYGEKGSPSREEFEAKAKAWYYAEILRDERKRLSSYERSLRDLDEGRVIEYDSLDDLIKEIEH